ncbi:hypothetical protein TWF481_003745 [Arthrobotrys musiformis]|uniref:Peptidase S8/S53 domain-containing protein n=1 Tax=Arthrobotrys musiformis TaxID=47236 RepID=A0AAV9WIR6_9PEZI
MYKLHWLIFGLLSHYIQAAITIPQRIPPGKAGTWPGAWSRNLWCIVNKSQRTNDALFKELDKGFFNGALAGWLLPPAKFSAYKVKSEHLGVWAYAIISGAAGGPVALETSLRAFFKTKGIRYPFTVCEWYAYQLSPPGVEHWYDQEGNGSSQNKIQSRSYIGADRRSHELTRALIRNKRPDSRNETSKIHGSRYNVRGLDEPSNKNEVVVLKNAPTGLPMLSAPKDPGFVRAREAEDAYFHYKNPGKGVIIYVLDTGFERSHEEVEDIKIQDWILGGNFPIEKGTESPYDRLRHGTLLAAKIAGKRTGIAQDAELVIAAQADGTGLPSYPTFFDTILRIYDHIKSQNPDKPCIISITTKADFDIEGSTTKSLAAGMVKEIMYKLRDLENVIVVTYAGNENPDVKISDIIPKLGADKSLTNSVVAGAVDKNGLNYCQSDAAFRNMVWAQGQDVEIPTWPKGYRHKDVDGGTSMASATVSGILASYLSQDLRLRNRVENAVERLKSLSWEWNSSGPPVIHNGITPDQWPAEGQWF